MFMWELSALPSFGLVARLEPWAASHQEGIPLCRMLCFPHMHASPCLLSCQHCLRIRGLIHTTIWIQFKSLWWVRRINPSAHAAFAFPSALTICISVKYLMTRAENWILWMAAEIWNWLRQAGDATLHMNSPVSILTPDHLWTYIPRLLCYIIYYIWHHRCDPATGVLFNFQMS